MPLTAGRYAEYTPANRREALAHRLFWLRHNVTNFIITQLREPRAKGGQYLSREWGFWMVRPTGGFRSRQWISVPLYATRSIPADDHDGALQWCMERLGI